MTRTAETIRNYTAGDTLRLKVTAKEEDGTIIPLSGAELVYGLAKDEHSTPEFTKDTTNGGITITEASKGKFRVEIEPADTEPLEGQFYHEVELTDSVNDVSTLFKGYIEIDPSIV